MTKRYNDLTPEERAKIREDMSDHGNVERAAKENDVSEVVIQMVWDR